MYIYIERERERERDRQRETERDIERQREREREKEDGEARLGSRAACKQVWVSGYERGQLAVHHTTPTCYSDRMRSSNILHY